MSCHHKIRKSKTVWVVVVYDVCMDESFVIGHFESLAFYFHGYFRVFNIMLPLISNSILNLSPWDHSSLMSRITPSNSFDNFSTASLLSLHVNLV